MPRQKRTLGNSNMYHIMMRGNEKKRIFVEEEDKEKFIRILIEKKKISKFDLYAYCLMDNHLHLLINEKQEELSTIIKRIAVSYVYYFNKKYGRIGHLFHDRFRSEVIDSDNYLLAATRYIHNNPVEAGLSGRLDAYKWSSFRAYMNQQLNNEGLVNTDMVLEHFSKDKKIAIKSFIEYSRQTVDDSFIDVSDKGIENKEIKGILNTEDFIKSWLKKYRLQMEDLKLRKHIEKRNELISLLKEKSTLSIREIAGVLGLDRNIVQRM